MDELEGAEAESLGHAGVVVVTVVAVHVVVVAVDVVVVDVVVGVVVVVERAEYAEEVERERQRKAQV